ncbi:MAG: MlaD family protein [Solirubrobacterales bacterium]
MSRGRAIAATALVVAAAIVVVVLLASGGGNSGYQVRAIFDNGAFMVQGEQVRVAGANVGTIESVGVTLPGETVAFEGEEPVSEPGKAAIVLDITDPGFQDFREDATCQIRPQSLIGEKFVDCRPTLPRAPGSEPPPPLREVPEGEPGEGQHLLPLGSNGTSVDPDLINDIQTLPYAQRFRLIFNELGAGFAGRGGDIEELVKRANPVLRDAGRMFGILARQRKQLAQLAADSDAILAPLARERGAVAGFITNAGATAEASAERGAELEASFAKLPRFLSEFRQTMRSLQGFADAGTPVFDDLGTAAPSLTRATRLLTPFSEALTVSLRSLGGAGEASGPILREAEPIVRKSGELGTTGVVPTRELARLTTNIKQTKGWDYLVRLIYNASASVNGFDEYGHFGRTRVALADCTQYQANKSGKSGCVSRFHGPEVAELFGAGASKLEIIRRIQARYLARSGGAAAPPGAEEGPTAGLGQATETEPEAGVGGAESPAGTEATEGTEPLIDYLLGP